MTAPQNDAHKSDPQDVSVPAPPATSHSEESDNDVLSPGSTATGAGTTGLTDTELTDTELTDTELTETDADEDND
jgi:hypothetical protein